MHRKPLSYFHCLVRKQDASTTVAGNLPENAWQTWGLGKKSILVRLQTCFSLQLSYFVYFSNFRSVIHQLQFSGKTCNELGKTCIKLGKKCIKLGKTDIELGNICPKPSHMSFFYVCLCRPLVLIILAYDRCTLCPKNDICQFKDMSDVVFYVCCVGPGIDNIFVVDRCTFCLTPWRR